MEFLASQKTSEDPVTMVPLAAVSWNGSYQWAPLASFIYHHIHKTELLTFTLCGNLPGILLKMQVLFL